MSVVQIPALPSPVDPVAGNPNSVQFRQISGSFGNDGFNNNDVEGDTTTSDGGKTVPAGPGTTSLTLHGLPTGASLHLSADGHGGTIIGFGG